MKYTDKQLLDFLQEQLDMKRYTGTALFRLSTTERGWRCGETSWKGAVTDIREAIANGIREFGEPAT